MKTFIVSFCIFVIAGTSFAQQAPLGKLLNRAYSSLKDNDESLILITLKDKGNAAKYRTSSAQSFVSEHSLKRRATVRDASHLIDEQDFPLEQSYVQQVIQHVQSVRHQLKWFNAISAIATKQQIETLRQLPFVTEVELVGRWKKRSSDEQEQSIKETQSVPTPSSTTSLDYGTSFTQVNQIKVPVVHNLGIYGQGVNVGVFDNGFRLLTHEAFASMNIIAQHDFVDHKESVIPNNPSTGFGSHGVNTLSTIGGYKPGQLIGPAFKANFILARTENDSSETPIEEDNWAAAIQWADSIGVDVTSCSLGYLTYDAPYTSWTWQDMNGNTTLITKAADHAVGLGIVVVNSAGNGGGNGIQNTLGAPADGDSVISAGAVTSAGVRTSFSSTGPTTDIPARIKPDIMAMGSGVKVASSTITNGYGSSSGTSFSCPLSAGVAALIRCANPTLTPMQVRDAMRQTASQAATPDNLMGWGILNADSAIKYFGALSLGHIRGTKFNDLNGNGVKDAGEPGVAGVTIHLGGTMSKSTITDGSGNYHFDSLAIGTFIISEDVPSGWVQTLPISGGSYSVALLFQVDTTGFNFGNFHRGSISGMKFDDINSNGIKEGGEGGLPNWVIHLTGPETLRTATDINGNYLFSNIGPGTYTVSESLQVGWMQTLPPANGSYTVTMRSGLDTTGLLFGNGSAPESTYFVNAGWNLLSLPQNPADHSKNALYPSALSRAFNYTSTNGYLAIDTLPNGIGYWLKFASSQNVVIAGLLLSSETIGLTAGWNMIGTLSKTVAASSVDDPDSVIMSPFYGYTGVYVNVDSLRPHEGYWVRAKAPGSISLNASIAHPSTTEKNFLDVARNSLNSITVKDRSGVQQTLYFGHDETHEQSISKFDLPPVPPADGFDVRFDNGSSVWLHQSASANVSKVILLQGVSSPTELSWSMKESQTSYILAALPDMTTRTLHAPTYELRNTGSMMLNTLGVTRLELQQHSPVQQIPKEFRLDQNYPNPFNPTTTIIYALPKDATVKAQIFNLIGQDVRTLIDARQPAGTYSIQWDGKTSTGIDLPGGMYFLKLTASSNGAETFSSVKKMVFLK